MLGVVLIHAHVLDGLRSLPDESVGCCVTSPPYWNLRDYNLQPAIWGGDPNHRHETGKDSGSQSCTCGAWRGQLGLEPTVELYVEHLVQAFREVRRVLASWGTCWINLGDSSIYSGCGPEGKTSTLGGSRRSQNESKRAKGGGRGRGSRTPLDGQTAGVPWRVAFALQADGWMLRPEVIWRKPAPVPENVTGWRWIRHRDCPGCPKCDATDGYVLRRGMWRPTRAHEYIFLLAKTGGYFCDGEAVREPVSGGANSRGSGIHPKSGGTERGTRQNPSFSAAVTGLVQSRNPRSVWTVAPEPYRGQHYASYPTALPERIIRAATPEAGCCSACGSPWAPVVESRRCLDGEPVDGGMFGSADKLRSGRAPVADGMGHSRWFTLREVHGHRPTCSCDAPARPAVVLDPFAGTAATGVAARRLGRRFVGIDLSFPYLLQARDRIDELCMTARSERARVMPAIEGPLFEEAS